MKPHHWVIIIVVLVLVAGGGAAFSLLKSAGGRQAAEEFQNRSQARADLEKCDWQAAFSGPYPPTGKWSGMYTESSGVFGSSAQKVSSYNLTFSQNGQVSGEGSDSDGSFSVDGRYSMKEGQVAWKESYYWGTCEVEGIISLTGSESAIQASFLSSKNISGTLLIKAQNHKMSLREAAKVELYAGEDDDTKDVRPPDLERSNSWSSRNKPGRVKRAPIQVGYALQRLTSKENLGTRLQKKGRQANGRLGDSKADLGAPAKSTRKVAPSEGSSDGLPAGWKAAIDRTYFSGQMYYVNTKTKETTWEKPTKPCI